MALRRTGSRSQGGAAIVGAAEDVQRERGAAEALQHQARRGFVDGIDHHRQRHRRQDRGHQPCLLVAGAGRDGHRRRAVARSAADRNRDFAGNAERAGSHSRHAEAALEVAHLLDRRHLARELRDVIVRRWRWRAYLRPGRKGQRKDERDGNELLHRITAAILPSIVSHREQARDRRRLSAPLSRIRGIRGDSEGIRGFGDTIRNSRTVTQERRLGQLASGVAYGVPESNLINREPRADVAPGGAGTTVACRPLPAGGRAG